MDYAMDNEIIGGHLKSISRGFVVKNILNGTFDFDKLKKDVKGKENIKKFDNKIKKIRDIPNKLSWIKFVKQYSMATGLSFKDAMKNANCKQEYYDQK